MKVGNEDYSDDKSYGDLLVTFQTWSDRYYGPEGFVVLTGHDGEVLPRLSFRPQGPGPLTS